MYLFLFTSQQLHYHILIQTLLNPDWFMGVNQLLPTQPAPLNPAQRPQTRSLNLHRKN